MGLVRQFFSSASAILGFTASVFQLLGIASIGSLFLPDKYKPGPTYLLWVAILLALVFGAASSIYMAVRAFRRIRDQLAKPYDVVSEGYELIVRQSEIIQITRLYVRFYRGGHYTYPHRYYWSGGAKPTINVRLPLRTTYLEVGQSQHWTIGQFVLPQIVRKAEIIVLEFEHVMQRTAFQAYVSRTTEESAASLTLKVKLDDGSALASVVQLINYHPSNEGAAQTVPVAASHRQEHEWRIPQALPHTQYMLGWTTV